MAKFKNVRVRVDVPILGDGTSARVAIVKRNGKFIGSIDVFLPDAPDRKWLANFARSVGHRAVTQLKLDDYYNHEHIPGKACR